MGPDRYDQLARIHADMLNHAPEMARYQDAPSYIANAPFLVARYATAGAVSYFFVNTFRQQRGDAKTAPELAVTPHKDGVMRRSMTLLQEDVLFADLSDGPIARVLDLDNINDPTARQDRYLSVQLLHELFHARIVIERDARWPVADRTLLAEYEAWRAPYFSGPLQKIRAALLQRFGTEKEIEHFLNEKFVIQKAFKLYGVHAFNEEIAAQYARKNRGDREAVIELYRQLDRAHNDVVAPYVIPLKRGEPGYVPPPPATPPPPPSWRPPKGTILPGFQPFWTEARYRPPAIPVNRFVTSPILRRYVPPAPAFKPYVPPPRAFVQPPPVRRPDFGIQHGFGRTGDPARRDWFGPIKAAAPPPWTRTRPEPFRPGNGSGWDPNRFHFDDSVSRMKLSIQHPRVPVYIPRVLGEPATRLSHWDPGSRD
jgi:hypothetical protein